MKTNITRRTTLSIFALMGLEKSLEDIASTNKKKSNIIDNIPSDSWPTYNYDPCNIGYAEQLNIGGELTETWTKEVDDPTSPLVDDLSPLIRYNNKLYYCTGRAIIARGSADGSLIWSNDDQGRNDINVVPAISEKTLFTADSNISAWDTETGELIWEATIGSTSEAALNVDEDAVYISISSGRVNAYDKYSGEELWSTSTFNNIVSSVAVCEGKVFAANKNGTVYAIEDGERIWSTDIAGSLIADPCAVDNKLYVGGVDVPLTVLNIENGEKLWESFDVSEVEFTPRIHKNTCITANKSGEIYSMNTSEQNIEWSQSLDDNVSTSPILINETVVVATDQGRVIGFDFSSGNEKWKFDLLNDSIVGLIGGNDAIYVSGKDGNIGGIHVDGTLSPRSKVQKLIEDINTAKNDDIQTSQAESYLSSASEALAEQDYDTAENEAEAGISELQPHIASREDASDRIDELSTMIENNSSFNLTESRELLDEAQDAFREGEYVTAESKASDGLDQLNSTVTTAETAQELIQDLNESISNADPEIDTVSFETEYEEAQRNFDGGNYTVAQDKAGFALEELEIKKEARANIDELESKLAENESLDLSESKDLLDIAEQSYGNDDFSGANSNASEGLDKLGETIEIAESAESSILQLNNTISDTDDSIEVTEFRSEYQFAQDAYRDGEYQEANEVATNATNKLQNKKIAWEAINNAEGVSQHFAADPIAEIYGYSNRLESARTAYEQENYIQAQDESNSARYAYWLARVTVEGTVGTGLIAGTLYIRYPKKMASLSSNIKNLYNQ